MSSEKKNKQIDNILKLLSKPLTRYILSILAGVDPGEFINTDKASRNENPDWD